MFCTRVSLNRVYLTQHVRKFERKQQQNQPWSFRVFCSGNNLVIVESPAKVQKIKQFLGSGYDVIATQGHIRQIRSSSGSVDPDQNFEIRWDSDSKQQKSISNITNKVKSAQKIILATDPDREGEAISWHVQEIMRAKKSLKKSIQFERITFTEITKSAVQAAVKNARQVDQDLVNAYLARSVLDYLVGYTLSPVLWRKVKGCKSAGRVQSPALRLVVDREHEILQFQAQEFWDVDLELHGLQTKLKIQGKLTHFDDKKLNKFDIKDEKRAEEVKTTLENVRFIVKKCTQKQRKVSAPAPFKTSSLQQDAYQKLNLYPKQAMKAAQKLYESGLITYMRTDGISMSSEAVNSIRDQIKEDHGEKYIPQTANVHNNKSKNSQEAHEAIRITDPKLSPKLAALKDKDQIRLYQLIWQRTMASQMQQADDTNLSIQFESEDGKHKGRASVTERVFDGWSKMYQDDVEENQDLKSSNGEESDGEVSDAEDGDESYQALAKSLRKTGQNVKQKMNLLKSVKEGDVYEPEKVLMNQHFTQPPPRYNDASLVKALEQLGIGRPSTYATILSVLKDRDYIHSENRALKPTSKGRVLSTFLTLNFQDYVNYDFTSRMESQLDEVATGSISWQSDVLDPFWNQLTQETKTILGLNVIDVQDEMFKVLAPIYLQKLQQTQNQLQQNGDEKLQDNEVFDENKLSNQQYQLQQNKNEKETLQDNEVFGENKLNNFAFDSDTDKRSSEDSKSGKKVAKKGKKTENSEEKSKLKRKGLENVKKDQEKDENEENPNKSTILDPQLNDFTFQCPQCSKGKLFLMNYATDSYFGCSEYKTGPCNYKVYFDQEAFNQDDLKSLSINGSVFENGALILGQHPESNKEILLKQGPFGWYLQLGKNEDYPKGETPRRQSLGKKKPEKDLTLEKAIKFFEYPKLLGVHEDMEVFVKSGRFGFYVQIGDSMRTVPKAQNLEEVNLEIALDLLKKKVEKMGIKLGERTSRKSFGKKGSKSKEASQKTSSKKDEKKDDKKDKKTSSKKDDKKGQKTSFKKEDKTGLKTSSKKGDKKELPKKKSSWQIFIQRHFKEQQQETGSNMGDLMKVLGEKWRLLSKEEKAAYVDES